MVQFQRLSHSHHPPRGQRRRPYGARPSPVDDLPVFHSVVERHIDLPTFSDCDRHNYPSGGAGGSPPGRTWKRGGRRRVSHWPTGGVDPRSRTYGRRGRTIRPGRNCCREPLVRPRAGENAYGQVPLKSASVSLAYLAVCDLGHDSAEPQRGRIYRWTGLGGSVARNRWGGPAPGGVQGGMVRPRTKAQSTSGRGREVERKDRLSFPGPNRSRLLWKGVFSRTGPSTETRMAPCIRSSPGPGPLLETN